MQRETAQKSAKRNRRLFWGAAEAEVRERGGVSRRVFRGAGGGSEQNEHARSPSAARLWVAFGGARATSTQERIAGSLEASRASAATGIVGWC